MTGDKPDERLRTPMQWSPTTGVGFTRGKEWEAPQADSLTVNVALEDRDPRSLLTRYRQLIQLRRANEALASGRLVFIWTSNPRVTAYARRSDGQTVMVIANLSDSAVADLVIASAPGLLPQGRYTTRKLLGGPASALFEAQADGSLRGGRLRPWIEGRETWVFELVRR